MKHEVSGYFLFPNQGVTSSSLAGRANNIKGLGRFCRPVPISEYRISTAYAAP